MKRINHFLFCTLFLGATTYNINLWGADLLNQYRQHQALGIFHATYFINHSEEFDVDLHTHLIDNQQALILIKHEVAPSNKDPFAQPFCTCVCYLTPKVNTKAYPDRYDSVPKEYMPLVKNIIKQYKLPPLQPLFSPNLKLANGYERQRYEETKRIIHRL